MTRQSDDFVTVAEAARLARVSRWTVWRAARRGELRAVVTKPNVLQFRLVDAERWAGLTPTEEGETDGE